LITKEGWKLIQLTNKSFQLYHILNDPGEYKNVAAEHPELMEKLITLYQAQLNSHRPDL